MMQPAWEALQLHPVSTPTIFPVGPANVYLYTGVPVTLFDAGTNTEEAFAALNAGVTSVGIQMTDIRQIILTHHHLDHTGLTKKIKDLSGAQILVHKEAPTQIPFIFDEAGTRVHLEALFFELGTPESMAETAIAQRVQFRWLMEEFDIDGLIEDQDEIGPFVAHFRPGHSVTDTVFIHREHGWAVTGDHLIHNVTPNPLLRRCLATGEREKSLVQYHESLLKTRDLDITWCFAGHGAPFNDHRRTVDATFRHIERRSQRIYGALPGEGATPYTVTTALFPQLNDSMFYYSLSAITSHLELLETQGKVVSEHHGGVIYYYPGSSA